ncbi:hypothetical protein BDQ94DRAFT_152627 [Aspergillus welwitschiae]|uniref:Uncharacterized protein n=1 Tax=Aspergillus welwitschiae TaxID=1341132 RepID=A0A3F3PMT4_9EURO|nr:hypothetical protein BDQ94DRAFT_152627 [Aspergillus welwitschiae]RDH28138.1 hypothetical protein BDQ94DRAFT_152627 [Aspergillus welwitschiae]
MLYCVFMIGDRPLRYGVHITISLMLNSRVWVSQPDTTEPRPVSAPFRLSRMLSSYLPLLCAYTVRRMMISD